MINVTGNGSPLDARQNKMVYLILVLAAIVIGVFVLVYFALKAIKKIQQSEAWIEAHKKRPTTVVDVHKLAKQMNFSQDEENVLWEACKRTKAPNIIYLVKDMKAIDDLLRKEFGYLRAQKIAESTIYILFSLRQKIATVNAQTSRLKTTFAITLGQIIYISRSATTKIPMEVVDNIKNGLYLLLPSNMQTQTSRPVELSKVQFTIPASEGGLYTFFSRVVRYTTMKDGRLAMIVSHTNEVVFQERRKQKRIDVSMSCDFSAVKIESKGKGKVLFLPQTNRHDARLKDISAGGCKIMANMPIKEGQHIHIKWTLTGTVCEAVGVIIRTTKGTEADAYYLAIKFAQITDRVRNDILAFVYKYV